MRSSTSARMRAVLTALVLLFLATIVPAAHADHATSSARVTKGPSTTAAPLYLGMRKLWQDHVLWTRLVIVSTAAGLPDLQPTTDRLLQNQADIGNAVRPYYGDAAATKLTDLLREHIMGAAKLLAAAKANDTPQVDAAKTAWFANADQIATFLAGANPKHWTESDLKSMMHKHLDLTLTEAVDQLQGRYAESVAGYDKVQDEILEMADMLSEGIVKQFPSKFDAGRASK
ncbi:MAG TPA: hypothetical protein VJY35_02425 [Candidatus Eisenbacteria bacterium]|nr:hypothetical protein [Candidatus Eisenbacteria bacterium]